MSQTDKQIIGQKGEDLAADYLKKQGYVIADRRYLKKWGELDIVARKGKSLRFVEVKTVTRNAVIRETGEGYEAEENIHAWKLARLGRTIETYLLEKRIGDDIEWQLDAITVWLSPEAKLLKISVLEDIF